MRHQLTDALTLTLLVTLGGKMKHLCARVGVIPEIRARDLVIVDEGTTSALVPDLEMEPVHIGAGCDVGIDCGEIEILRSPRPLRITNWDATSIWMQWP